MKRLTMTRRGILVVGAILLLQSCNREIAEPAVPAPPRSAPPAARHESPVARGAYLVNGVGRCFWCHSPQDDGDPSSPRPEMLGAGDVLDELTPVIAPNLTPDRETGLGQWSDGEIVRAVREGVGRDGVRLRADHPTAYYRVMSDDDAAAVVAYLRSLKPIRNALPRSKPQERFRESVQPIVAPVAHTPEEPLARGAYLVQLGECLGCHTTSTKSGDPRRELAFGGGRRFVETRKGFGYELSPDPAFSDASPPAIGEGERIVTTANLTPDPSGIPYYTPEVFIQTIRSGRVAGVRKLSSAMPWIYFRRLTDDDLRAIFLYLQQVQPVQHHVNNTDEPTMCELCGRKHGLGDVNVVRKPDAAAHRKTKLTGPRRRRPEVVEK